MLVNISGSMIIEGVTSNTKPLYKRNYSTAAPCKFYVIDKTGAPLGTVALVVTSDVGTYFIRHLELYAASTYDLYGTCTPGGSIVYLSKGFTRGSITALKENIIATTESTPEGDFVFNDITGIEGQVSLWICATGNYGQTGGITCDLLSTSCEVPDGFLLADGFMQAPSKKCDKCNGEGSTDFGITACTKCGGTGNMSDSKGYDRALFKVTGMCEQDVEKIYISACGNTLNLNTLTETIHCTIVPTNGSFTISDSFEYNQEYTAWGISKANGILSVNKVLVSEDTSCLSADTMITMADGSQRRLDCLSVGDMVMSEDGKPTRVYNLMYNNFSDYHNLYYFDDGTIIDETHPHRFYNVEQGFWQRLQLWNIGDHAIKQNGDKTALVAVERLDEQAEMFGVWTDSGTYYANGLLSGEAACNKKLLKDATAEQAVDMMLSADESWLLQLIGLEGLLP